MTKRIALLALALAGAAAPVGAQVYRDNVPDVMTPPPTPRAAIDDARASFRKAYSRARSPRLAVFWNRELSDETSTAYQRFLRIDRVSGSYAAAAASERARPYGYDSAAVGGAVSASSTELTAGERRIDPSGRDAALSERADYRVESAFASGLLGGGARLIDRSLMMRTAALGRNDRNRQSLETRALLAKADLLIEVLQTDDPGGPIGAAFKITVKDLRSGRLLASVASDGTPPRRGPARLVAGSYGFVRDTPPEPNADAVGETLAAETMRALADAWR